MTAWANGWSWLPSAALVLLCSASHLCCQGCSVDSVARNPTPATHQPHSLYAFWTANRQPGNTPPGDRSRSNPRGDPANAPNQTLPDRQVASAAPGSVVQQAGREFDPIGDGQFVRPVSSSIPFAHSISQTSVPEGSQLSMSGPHEWSASIAGYGQQRLARAESLAAKGAFHSARQELIDVLQAVAYACDAQDQSCSHAEALSLGLTALDEAGDFLNIGSDQQKLSVHQIAAGHRTPILQAAPIRSLSPIEAVQQYCNLAIVQLTYAAGSQPVASEALHALGRVTELQYAVGPGTSTAIAAMTRQRMLVYYKSAVCIDPANYCAANELGVLLARSGQLQLARAAFEQSLAVHDSSECRRNLSLVHDWLGNQEAARAVLADAPGTGPTDTDGSSPWSSAGDAAADGALTPTVYWVDPQVLIDQSPAIAN